MSLDREQREEIVFNFIFKNEVTEFGGEEDINCVFGISFSRFPTLENHINLSNLNESDVKEILDKLLIQKHNLFSINDVEIIAKIMDSFIDIGEENTIEIIFNTIFEFDESVEDEDLNVDRVPVRKINKVINEISTSRFISSLIDNLKEFYKNSERNDFVSSVKQKRAERLPVFN